MDDIQIIEAVEAVRDRLREELPGLEALLERQVMLDYHTALPGDLQECLVCVTFDLNPLLPRDARQIQRRIALAETAAPAMGAGQFERKPSWVIQEQVLDIVDLEQDVKFSQGLRYLSLPGSAAQVVSARPEPVDSSAVPQMPVGTGAQGNGSTVLAGAPADAPGIPSRFGKELAECVGLRAALTLIRKRLPSLKGALAYKFLAMVGYPVAVPTADAQRFCRYIGLLGAEDKGAADRYMAIIERASRVTGVPMAHIGYLLSVYAGGEKVDNFAPVCGVKAPRCEACSLAGRCSYFGTAATQPAAAKEPVRGRAIKDWHVDERPRERMLAGERLSNSELLAIILRTGTGKLSAVELARELLHTFGTLHDLEKSSPQEIVERMRGKGIGPAKAVEICAAIELGRRVTQPAADTRLGLRMVTTSRDIFELCRPRYKAATQEEFLLLVLNTKSRVQKEVPVSLGTLNSSIVHPRDVFRHALREAAAAVIFVHNHPSGDPTPSDEDILLTARLVDAGKLLGIQVIDHVIIGSHEWYSFSDHGRLR